MLYSDGSVLSPLIEKLKSFLLGLSMSEALLASANQIE